MTHMKNIIESMYGEIADLRRHLEQERQERNKYSSMMEQFASKVQNVRKSKEKHYIPHHHKRNSHIPSSGAYQNDFDEIYDQTHWQANSTAILRHREKLKQNQDISTLKKKGMHKYKMSQIFNVDYS